jgi:hypothetical protein
MTELEITAVRGIEDELNMSWTFKEKDRPVEIVFGGDQLPSISNVRRFDSTHNNFADRVEEIMPYLVRTEENAKWYAQNEAADYFGTYGIIVSPEELALYGGIQQWALENDVPQGIVSSAISVYQKSFAEGRLFDVDLLNHLPQMSVNSMTAREANVTSVAGSVAFQMEPNSVVIFDLYL